MIDFLTRCLHAFLRHQAKKRDRRRADRTHAAMLRAHPELRRHEDAIQSAKRQHRPTRRLSRALRDAKIEMLRSGR